MAGMMTRRHFLRLAGLAAGAGLLGRATLTGGASPYWTAGGPSTAGVKLGHVRLAAVDLGTGELRNLALRDGELRLAGSGEAVCVSPVVSAPFPFTAVAPSLEQSPRNGGLRVALRVSSDEALWGDWQEVGPEPALADAGGEDVLGALFGLFSSPLPRFVQARLTIRGGDEGSVLALRSLGLLFFDTSEGPTSAEALAASGGRVTSVGEALSVKPAIVSRLAWGCPDGQYSPRWPAEYQSVTHMFVHHTATANNQPDWAAVVRAVWAYHANGTSPAWGDIGYNFLVDPNGVLYEGRAGGDDVVAGHTYGFNRGTLGLAFLGTYGTVSPTGAMLSSAESLFAWKSTQRSIDPLGSRSYLAYPSCPAKSFVIPTLLGHRDAPGHSVDDSCNTYGPTSCPGNALHGLLPTIRTEVRARLLNAAVGQVTLTPSLLVSGALLRVEVTVLNTGGAPLTSQNPPPGFVYEEGQSFQSLGYAESEGAFRVGVDFEGRAQPVDHPYRWGLGGTLAPGASATVTGYIRLNSTVARAYWAGVVQEAVRWWQDNLGRTGITVVAAPQVTLNPVTTDKTWFALTWQGSGGIGALRYRLDSSSDGVTWRLWTSTTTTRAIFFGEANRLYYLRATAIDSAGNASTPSQISVRTGADSTGVSRVTLPVLKNQ